MLDVLLHQMILLLLFGAGVPLLVGTCSGLVVAVLQTATSIQEQSISFLAKLFSVGGLLYLFRGWLGERIIAFFQLSLDLLAQSGKI